MECKFIHIVREGNRSYSGKEDYDREMGILSCFLTDDVSCSNADYYINLVSDAEFHGGCANATCIEKENGYISLCLEVDIQEEDRANAVWFKIPIPQFVTLLEKWRDQVCKLRPSEVIIRYENGDFIFEIIP